MSYLDRVRQNRQAFEFNRQTVPSNVQTLAPIPQDTTKALYQDKMNEYRDKLAEDLTAPFTTVGGVDLVRRGINAIPAIQDIRNMMAKGGKAVEKVRNLIGSDGVQNLLKDPQGYIENLAGDLKDKLVGSLNEGIQNVSGSLQNAVGEVGDKLNTLGQALPDSTESAIQTFADQAGQAGERVATSLASGVKRGLGLPDAQPQPEVQVQAPPPNETEEEFNQRFQDTLDQLDGARAQEAGAQEATQEAQATQDPSAEEDVFHDAVTGEEGRGNPIVRRQGARDLMDQISRKVKDVTGIDVNPISASGEELPAEAKDDIPDYLKSGSGEQLDWQKANDLLGKDGPPPESTEGEIEQGIKGQEQTADRLGDLAAQASEQAGAEAGGDGMGDVLSKVAGDGVDGEIATGLGVADAIPVLGTLADLGSIGAIVGEAVDFYNNKAKEAKDAEALAERQSAIEKDISQEQSEIVGQARSQAQQNIQQVQQIAQQKQPLPTAQVGAEPS